MDALAIWAMYFAGIVSFKMHPRNDKEVDLEHCAYIADQMLLLTGRRFKWAGSDQPSQQ